jgi:hypothetical protein
LKKDLCNFVSFELQLVKFACVSQRFENVLLNFTEPNLDTLIFVQGLDLELDSEKGQEQRWNLSLYRSKTKHCLKLQ